jgi:2',3'-cyclic-nucleotide 2'-phosphodiesterase (5'-nucleotidase family)
MFPRPASAASRRLGAGRPLRMFVAVCLGLAPGWTEVRQLTILHTNDLHARLLPDSNGLGGFAHLATALRRETAGCRWCLVLNAGDSVQGTPVSTLFRGLPVFEVLNRLAPDAATLGNHEFDYGWRRIDDFRRKARFPIVAANVQDEAGRLLTRRAFVTRTVNGLRVAVIGVLTADLPAITFPRDLGPWRTLPVLETVRRFAAELRGRADLVVALGHITPAEEDALLAQAPEVGVIISGHTHAGLEQPKKSGERVLVRVKGFSVELGRLDLEIDTDRKAPVSSAWRRIPIEAAALPAAPDVARAVDRWESRVSKIVDVPIGESRRQLREPEVKVLMEQAMAEETGADFAFMNLGGVRGFLPKGTLLARHVWTVMPFDNRVVVGTIRGRDLPKAVRDGRLIESEREYTLAVPDFVAVNQKTQFGVEGLEFPRVGRLQRDVFIDWIRRKKVLE